MMPGIAATAIAALNIPADWSARADAAHLVWAPEPFQGPRPNFGNGYAAMEFDGDYIYVAGVFSGGLPPPFGNDTAHGGRDTSHRAGIPTIALGVVGGTTDERGAVWQRSAIALDFEQASVEELLTRGNTTATLRQRHFFHRAQDRMHLLVADLALNNTAGTTPVTAYTSPPVLTTGGLGLHMRRLAPPPIAAEATCYGGTTLTAESPGGRVAVAACWDGRSTTLHAPAGKAAHELLVASIWSSLETDRPLEKAAEDWAAARALSRAELLESHTEAQQALWRSRIEVQGDHELAKLVNSSSKYLVAFKPTLAPAGWPR